MSTKGKCKSGGAVKVCVTGGSGFVASHVIKLLLFKGYKVVATCRDPNSKSIEFLKTLPVGEGGELTFAKAELLEDGSFDKAVEGCTYVLHVASPYKLTVDDPQRDLVDPARLGSLNLLQACAKTTSVKRVVLTSSFAAVTDAPHSNTKYSEADWNETSSLTRNPYYFSKVVAEKAAWKFMEENPKVSFDLVVINPPVILGPDLRVDSKEVNQSVETIKTFLDGTMPALLALQVGIVDVRDVAMAHVLAMDNKLIEGRNLCSAGVMTNRQIAESCRKARPELAHKVTNFGMDGHVGSWFVRHIGSHFQSAGVKSYLQTNLGHTGWSIDNGKIKAALGIEFRSLDETIKDTVDDLINRGVIE